MLRPSRPLRDPPACPLGTVVTIDNNDLANPFFVEASGQRMDPKQFIRTNTRLLAPPLVPEIRLHIAEESIPLWQKTEEELGAMNLPPPYWAFAWAGGQAMARHLLDNPAMVGGRRVLDLGSGSGLVAIAAAKAGAKRVLAADIDAFAVAAIELNSAANDVELETTADNLLAAPPGDFDVVLIGDLFYERSLAENVLTFADAAVAQGALVLSGDPRRSYFPTDRFQKLAEYSVPVTRELEDVEIKRTAMWQLIPNRRNPAASPAIAKCGDASTIGIVPPLA
jgi:predicted nicotinamide N-methyase